MTLRRDFLAFTAGAVAARTVLPAVARADTAPQSDAHPGDDAELLALCEAYHASEADRDLFDAKGCASLYSDDEVDAWNDENCDLFEDITATPATTPAGLRAKAAVLHRRLEVAVPEMLGDTFEECARPHESMALALCRDLMGEVT